jgi:hypothetical protein
MSARTKRTGEPTVVIGEEQGRDPAIDFMPKALRIYPRTLDVSVGKAGRGEAIVYICENDYEHENFYLNLKVEGPWNGNRNRFTKVSLDGATLTTEGLDNLIEALTVARGEAAKLGLFTKREVTKAKSA